MLVGGRPTKTKKKAPPAIPKIDEVMTAQIAKETSGEDVTTGAGAAGAASSSSNPGANGNTNGTEGDSKPAEEEAPAAFTGQGVTLGGSGEGGGMSLLERLEKQQREAAEARKKAEEESGGSGDANGSGTPPSSS